ncbi:glycosyltransferase involved in cell wall biosynthesis/CDP-glycerol glycerophosphotransferase (TagB/SpsB family) [Arcanobacterium wilhelmae]|uniref:Glycosyltransferase involved in cell wall biosynthesis/CDP-glycerol glycerophosphotransferase (TagB/SpsB family) n=1 Tax=Arcanobacterium wilhelmae TaxID=1803177 RepID=A0ABT9NDE7_9ACTO|nr:CDP-glycerol glycerophosphotransferase family protein [Arcanobacterium wilhelmae]MDP9801718.1 glycosyltransferase involved in cell wall biosynthesis/CDP-glycerol glycerophosphotransferase (TagB/SpsB family) [Arcanobacterium wilhelmae]WFN91036.1 CDP-glycerol glycerophosphotransferase family protein [Arcanobacterium wilhelmae]
MGATTQFDPLFTIVVPVYNTEKYVGETIDSIIRQAESMFERTEIILINDGSTDGSAEIAQSYVDRYPGKIHLFSKPNSGTSDSKNLGIEHARGQYVGFLDSDDLYGPNVLGEVAQFFAVHSDVDVVSIPMQFFDGRTGEHRLNNKFGPGTRVIDVLDDWKDVQLSAASCFVRRALLQQHNIRFDARIHLAEDAKFITQAIMVATKLGLVSSVAYLYRKRAEGSSAIDTFKADPASYTPVLRYAWEELFEQYSNSLGIIPKYVQNVAMHDMEWRLSDKQQFVLDREELDEYESVMRALLERIDVDVIMAQPFLRDIFKIYALSIKFGEDVVQHSERDGAAFYYRGREIWRFRIESVLMHVDYLDASDRTITLHGAYFGIQFPDIEFGILRNGSFIRFERASIPKWRQVSNNGRLVYEPWVFNQKFSAVVGDVYHPAVRLGDKIFRVRFVFEQMAKMPRFGGAHRVYGDIMLTNFTNRGLAVEAVTPARILKRELGFSRRIARPLLRRGKRALALLGYRWICQLVRPRLSKEIWLVSDRPYAAGDNGEAFFRYLATHTPDNVLPIFVIRKDSPDYPRMKQIGRVIDPQSPLFPLVHLMSAQVISSQADDVVVNAFRGMKQYMSDLYNFDFVFLQHGITKDDLSGWLNKSYKDIRVFVTSSPAEQASIANEEYGYTNGEVVLTGMPRFDRLENRPTKKIVFAPTWRQKIASAVDPATGQRPYAPGFKNTRYYQFIQELISDQRLNDALLRYGYEAELFLHPNHVMNSGDFKGGKAFVIQAGPHDYSQMFAQASLLITDYSSVAFDFAYLRKPVIYTQFDHDEFFSSHSYDEGYFSYENDGFGPVVYDVESTVDAILDSLDRGTQLSDFYRARISKFFAFDDRSNSERTLQAILQQARRRNKQTGNN